MLKMLHRLARPASLAMPDIGITPGNILRLRNASDRLVQRAFLAPRPAIGAQADMIDMRQIAHEVTPPILDFRDCQLGAGVQYMRHPIAEMPLWRRPAQGVETSRDDMKLFRLHVCLPYAPS